MNLFIQALVNGILLGGIYATYSAGFSLIFGVMGVVNIAHGELLMLGAFFSYWAYELANIDPFLSIPFAGVSLFIIGYFLQKYVINKVVDAPPIISYLCTFGIHLIIVNLALRVWSADYRSITVPYAGSNFEVMGIVIQYTRLITFLIGILSIFALYFFLEKTEIGRAIRATSQDREMARVMGIDVERIYSLTFAIGSAITGIAGVLVSTYFVIYPGMGLTYTINAFCVVVLGGMGYIIGALWGGLILGILEALTAAYLSSGISMGLTFFILFIMLILRPSGITGKGIVE